MPATPWSRPATGWKRCATRARRIPDLIILDLHMPGLDGFGVIQELRRDRAIRADAGRGADGERDAGRPGARHGRGIHRLHHQADPAWALCAREVERLLARRY